MVDGDADDVAGELVVDAVSYTAADEALLSASTASAHYDCDAAADLDFASDNEHETTKGASDADAAAEPAVPVAASPAATAAAFPAATAAAAVSPFIAAMDQSFASTTCAAAEESKQQDEEQQLIQSQQQQQQPDEVEQQRILEEALQQQEQQWWTRELLMLREMGFDAPAAELLPLLQRHLRAPASARPEGAVDTEGLRVVLAALLNC